ncbi:3-hydroxyacyl-CoA dehydrogenase NAD-binding domain-containing protein [Mesorhizobium retamae]|uniref:3-hydroxyacyl-CoA dehydrogenase NAD-binding domain-containing protein n=1 Tax=Mesorhizobium retamae TaxID=2912854 RepID=A0ABS9QDB5_9HYPH|nr:3-hydroxyacyl-CoA dehydrogenase NAD-binding domain-containing protein [Mesorhizobium sp. IRAMC:0171]MCG7505402.1 3-hydroxyacyl-CoA dehydrogenase NAD-binding domain-containing protein [Mesorhizobium sp. IRAMC:0171]
MIAPDTGRRAAEGERRSEVAEPTVTLSRSGSVGVITIDNPPVNALSQEVRIGLLSALEQAELDPTLVGGVLRCAGRTFVAGADITEMDAPPSEPTLPTVADAFERSRLCWVAAMHGTALGGGLELALACCGRVAEPGTRVGMPEVTLGIIPGAGGTVRLTSLIGAEAAARLVTTGKQIDAVESRQIGLIDVIAEDAHAASLEIAGSGGRAIETSPTPRAPKPEFWDQESIRVREKARGQESPIEALAAIREAATLPRAEALQAERRRFLRLRESEQAKALRHVFFAERKAGASLRNVPKAADLQRVGVVGGGTMGSSIATAVLISGTAVTLVEQDDAATARARNLIETNLKASAKRGVISSVEPVLARLSVCTALSDLEECPLVIEAVFEDMAIKTALFKALDDVLPATAVLATNTSYLDVRELARSVRDPSRVLGLHFFAPAHVMKLLEVVRLPQTSDPALAAGSALARQLRKTAVVTGVCEGFIGNRIMAAYRRNAEEMLLRGAQPETIDAAMRDYGFAAGIFETQDLSGLDIAWAMRKRRRLEGKDPAIATISDALCEVERLGRKTMGGWYDYVDGRQVSSPETARLIAEFRDGAGITPRVYTAAEIVNSILAAMSREAEAILREGIAEGPDDIDVVMIVGFGFPRYRGGPMYIARKAQ